MTRTRSGPVRSEAARLAILSATAQLFAENGYDNLTMEGIAARAGVGKQTIYRWWDSKGALVAECLIEGRLPPEPLSLHNTGDIRRDLIDWVDLIFRTLSRPSGEGLLRSLIAAAAENADVGYRLRQSLAGAGSLVGRLEAALGTAPNLCPGGPLDEVADALIGAVILRALSRAPVGPGDSDRIVDVVLGIRPAQDVSGSQ